ncbi:MAG: hypothetical protein KDA20_12645, partial [Phycisphaerales bacterium]|nr:hypothetical protein [Phycisphaerales bacterium]
NYARVEKLLDGVDIAPGDLIVLPEMFDTGFSFHVAKNADAPPLGDGATAAFLGDLARRRRCTVHGALTAAAGHQDFSGAIVGLNRAMIVGPDGETIAQYDKVHPFSYGKEAEHFAGGHAVVTYPWRAHVEGRAIEECELMVCPAICYDLRFPELFRAGLDLGAQAYAIGANWPSARAHHWRALIIARAIENQAFVFAVNRVGRDPALEYAGGSLVVSAKGEVLVEADDREQVVSASIDPMAMHRWRGEFPAWQDRRFGVSPGPATPA